MSAAQPVATRPDRAGGAPAGGRRHLGPALAVIATAQLMVVLDATIVNVALPHIQHALGFSGTGLEWVVNAYAVTFGGLLLLGGRAGDLLGRRRVLIAGLLLFSAASLAGGCATSQAGLLAARAVPGQRRGAGGGLPPRPRRRDHPRVPGRLGDRAGRAGHHGRHHPGPARGPHQPGDGRPGAAGPARFRSHSHTHHPGTRRRMR